MIALLVACASDCIDLLGVTTVRGNVDVEHTTANALATLAVAGKDDIPVAAGAARALVRSVSGDARFVHGDDGLNGAQLPKPGRMADSRHAIDLMAAAVEASAAPITLVATGPLTNVALFLSRYPELFAKLERLVMMGTSIGAGNIGGVAEFNIWCDPEAAYRVLTDSSDISGVPVTVVSLDVASKVTLSQTDLEVLSESGAIGSIVAEALGGQYLARFTAVYGEPRVPIYDALAIVEVLCPDCITYRDATISVDTTFGPNRGQTIVSFTSGSEPLGAPPVRIGVAADRRPASIVVDRLSRLG